MEISIVKIKNKIKELNTLTETDRKVLSVIDSFWGCSDNWIKANLASSLVKYAGCEAWKIAMNAVYQQNY